MHSPNPREGGHGRDGYRDVLTEVFDWLDARIGAVVAGGIDRGRIIVDPGIGFGKSLADNLALLNGLSLFHGLGCPIMLGASRKRLIGALDKRSASVGAAGRQYRAGDEGRRVGSTVAARPRCRRERAGDPRLARDA